MDKDLKKLKSKVNSPKEKKAVSAVIKKDMKRDSSIKKHLKEDIKESKESIKEDKKLIKKVK